MPELYVKCPQTGKEVPTGAWVDQQTDRPVDVEPGTVTCPACGETHEYDGENVFFELDEGDE